MKKSNTVGFTKASAMAIGGKGLLIALVFAGMGIQGCSKEDLPATSVGTDSPSVDQVREDENGVDITDESEAGQSVAPLAKAAPSCIYLSYRTSGISVYAKVENQCKTTQRVRLIWSRAFDGSCVSLRSGYYYEERRGKQASVSEIRGC